MQSPEVTARRMWLAVTITFVLFAAGLVLALLLLFSNVANGSSTGRPTAVACGSPVNGLFSGGSANVTVFGVLHRGPITSCADLLARRTAAAVALILVAAAPLAVALLVALRWHLTTLAALWSRLGARP